MTSISSDYPKLFVHERHSPSNQDSKSETGSPTSSLCSSYHSSPASLVPPIFEHSRTRQMKLKPRRTRERRVLSTLPYHHSEFEYGISRQRVPPNAKQGMNKAKYDWLVPDTSFRNQNHIPQSKEYTWLAFKGRLDTGGTPKEGDDMCWFPFNSKNQRRIDEAFSYNGEFVDARDELFGNNPIRIFPKSRYLSVLGVKYSITSLAHP